MVRKSIGGIKFEMFSKGTYLASTRPDKELPLSHSLKMRDRRVSLSGFHFTSFRRRRPSTAETRPEKLDAGCSMFSYVEKSDFAIAQSSGSSVLDEIEVS